MVLRKTRKWGYVEQEARRLADLGMKPLDIAKRLGLNRSTVQRWMHAGKLNDTIDKSQSPTPAMAAVEHDLLASATAVVAPPPEKKKRGRPRKEPQPQIRAPLTPDEWAKEIRATYDLDATDDQLVTMAQVQLTMSLNPVAAQVQLQAQAAFRASVKQLALTARIPKGEERMQPLAKTGTDSGRQQNPAVQRRSSADPRAFLMVVPPSVKPLECQHANENPNVCPCPPACSCRQGMCADKAIGAAGG
jgi:hypothetical protein